MTPIVRILRVVSLSSLAALGCASISNVEEPAQTAQTAKATNAPQEKAIQPTPAPSLQPVYFDTDQARLRADARASLQDRAQAIRQRPELGTVSIQGHCDERGSEEYNLALGEQRAVVVKRYLVDLGVPASRLETMTYGESRPAVAGHDEAAWRYNRRSEFASEGVQSARR